MLSECCEKGKTNLAYDYWRTIKTVIKQLKAIPSSCRTYLTVNLFTTLEPYKRLSQKKGLCQGKPSDKLDSRNAPFINSDGHHVQKSANYVDMWAQATPVR